MARKTKSKKEARSFVYIDKADSVPATKLVVTVTAKNPGQKKALKAISENQVTFLYGCPGSGKAQPLDSIIYCPNGPVKMKDIKVGDKVCTPDGSSAKVLAIYPQGEKDIYRLTFADGSSTECCKEHLWRITERQKRIDRIVKKVVDTQYLINNIETKYKERNIYIELSSPVNFSKKDLLIDPYILGVLIGDGNICNANVCISSMDEEILTSVSNDLPEGYSLKKSHRECDYRIVKTTLHNLNGSQSNTYKDSLRLYGLWGKKSYEKFIPEDYLYASEEQRWAILQGLMDTYGYVSKASGQANFCTSSKELAQNVKLLVDSLGGLCSISEKSPTYKYLGEKKNGRKAYICCLNLPDCSKAFRLSRKKEIAKPKTKYSPKKRILVSVEKIGRKEAQCIMIDSKDHLYLTDNFIVTHNTHCSVGYGVQELLKGNYEKLIFTRPYVEAGEKLGFLPGGSDNKFAPFVMPLYEVVSDYLSQEDIKKMIEDKKIIIYPLAYMRGAAQPLESKVLTSRGFIAMGDIKIGDMVIGLDGKETKVSGVFPQGKKKIYKITFSDGYSTECCADHYWMTRTLSEKRHNKDFSMKKTSEIMEYIKTDWGQKNHEIPLLTNPVEFENKDVSIDPYLLGLLLGDGSLNTLASITFTTADDELVQRIGDSLPAGMATVYASQYDYRLVLNGDLPTKRNPLRVELEKLNLIGKFSETKFIPDIYKFNSKEIRISILQGLMDSDGSIFPHRSGKSRMQYYSVSKDLAEGVVFIVQSLGGIAHLRLRPVDKERVTVLPDGRTIQSKMDIWVVDVCLENFNPFRLSRKARQYNPCRAKRLVDNIIEVGEKECQCISVENENGLYITDNFIVTHNTFKKSFVVADECQNTTIQQMRMMLTRIGEGSKIVCTGDVEQSDLGSKLNGLADAITRLQGVNGLEFVELGYESCVREKIVSDIDQRYKSSGLFNAHAKNVIKQNAINPNGNSHSIESEKYD